MADDAYAGEREALREVQARFEQAVRDNQIKRMRADVADSFSFVSFTDKAFDDFDAFQTQWGKTRDEMVGSGSFTTQLNPEPSIFVGDLAVCKGNALNHMVDRNGKAFEFTSHWTVIFRRTEEGWKAMRAHNSLDPFANPMLIHGVKQRIIKIGALAFLVGVLVGSMMGFLT